MLQGKGQHGWGERGQHSLLIALAPRPSLPSVRVCVVMSMFVLRGAEYFGKLSPRHVFVMSTFATGGLEPGFGFVFQRFAVSLQ